MKKFIKPVEGRTVMLANGKILAEKGEMLEYTPQIAARVVKGDAVIVTAPEVSHAVELAKPAKKGLSNDDRI